MSTTRAQRSEWVELRQLYQRNHPHDYRGLARRWWRTQTFVDRDDAHPGDLRGFAIASYGGRKGRRYGVIRVFEICPEDRDPLLERSLAGTCVAWLEAQGCTYAYIPALRNQNYAWLAGELGVGSGGFGAISLTPRPPKWHWVLDPRTGMVYPEAGPEGTPPGPPPEPFQAARQVWN